MISRQAPSAAHWLSGFWCTECDTGAIDNRQQHWDDRYNERGVAAPRAPEILTMNPEMERLVPTSGRALDIACGRGVQAAWLALRGLDVIALDVSGVAVALTNAAASARDVTDRVDARQQDLEGGLPDDLRDFEVIVCQRFRNRRVLEGLGERLRPNGVAFVTVLSAVELGRDPGKYHAPAGELIEVFTGPDIEVVWHLEAEGLAAIVIRRI
jgi:2-polyprenyl-3-methyl-5-hydroxy-6-metoxy-1,4-benzoquinol methylase